MPGMPDETIPEAEPRADPVDDTPMGEPAIEQEKDLMLHAQEWQALFMRKHREIESFRSCWMQQITEIGGFVEHLHDEGHEKLSFDEFMLMQKTVQGIPVVPEEQEEERDLMDALQGAVDYVMTMGRPPPPPEEIENMLKTIDELEQTVAE